MCYNAISQQVFTVVPYLLDRCPTLVGQAFIGDRELFFLIAKQIKTG
jgi:hypothetical protein